MAWLKQIGALALLCVPVMGAASCGRSASNRDELRGDDGRGGDGTGDGGAGSDPSAGGPSEPVECDGGRLKCDGACLDARFDPQNCGECGRVCAGEELCSSGQCGTVCLGGTQVCGARCVSVESDPANCGECGLGCEPDQVCYRGECRLTCIGGTERCGDRCADLRYDPYNCGACGVACGAGQRCQDGSCNAEACSAGRIDCGGVCVNPALDPVNCGNCGQACAAGEVCSQGVCGTSCLDSVLCGPTCVDTLSDAANCGGCDRACLRQQTCVNGECGLHCDVAGEVECGGACVDSTSDSAHCGGCFRACGAGRICGSSQCRCRNGTSECQGKCVDTSSDGLNCGACGVGCPDGETCVSGACDCKPGSVRCGGVCVDIRFSSAHCGACDAECALGKVCTDGICSNPIGEWPTFQGGIEHAGRSGDEIGMPPLTLAWERRLPGAVHPVVAKAGRVFVTESHYFSAEAPLRVFNLSDGADVWSYNFGDVSRIGHPSVSGDRVYVANGRGTSGTARLWSFEVATGDVKWVSTIAAQWEQYWSPLVFGSTIYSNGGYYGGLYGFDVTDGAELFFQQLEQTDSWSPGVWKGQLFTFVAGKLRRHDLLSGEATALVTVEGGVTQPAPVFDDSRAYLIASPNLFAIDMATSKVAWKANGTYSGTPAVADGVVYGISAGALVARVADTGALAWTFANDLTFTYPPIVAGGHVYVSNEEHLVAIDIATHKEVARKDAGGWLSISGRRLLAAGPEGLLRAFALTSP